MIFVQNLKKFFRRPEIHSGLIGTVRTLISPKYKVVEAIKDISFKIDVGESVGYIGPNGSGKSTTIKLLTGVLRPDDGIITVNDIIPWKNRMRYVQHIGVVFGQRSQLWWDLPAIQTFNLNKYVYRIPDKVFQRNINYFSDLFSLNEFINAPVRTLSLGQRMRAEITAALLHNPSFLFLDEPTIGLDFEAKGKIRQAISILSRETQVTVLLTSHDLQDIEEICERIIVIDQGKLIYDGALENLREQVTQYRTVVVDYEGIPPKRINYEGVRLIKTEHQRQWISIDRSVMSAADLLQILTSQVRIRDVIIQDERIEDMINRIYQGKISVQLANYKDM